MKLILLYGPPAVGKFTIAKELEKLTGFKNLHNHVVIDLVSDIFGFDHPSRRPLEHEIRKRLVEEAALSGIDLIVTGVINRANRDLYRAFIGAYQGRGGDAHLVQLKADPDILESRVKHGGREKKINSEKELSDFINEFPESTETFGEEEQLELDTSQISTTIAALKIKEHFGL
jgi:broad-specificity NMP kinase